MPAAFVEILSQICLIAISKVFSDFSIFCLSEVKTDTCYFCIFESGKEEHFKRMIKTC